MRIRACHLGFGSLSVGPRTLGTPDRLVAADELGDELGYVRDRLESLVGRRFVAPFTVGEEALYRDLVAEEQRLLDLYGGPAS